MKLNLKFDPKLVLGLLVKFKSYIIGAILIGVFGYTAVVVNHALNVKPAAAPTTAQAPRISFDKTTLQLIKKLDVVPGTVTPGAVGKSDPFGN